MKQFAAVIFWVVLVGGLGWLFFRYQLVIDYVFAANNTPSSQVVSLSNRIGLTKESMFLIDATQAKLDDRQDFNRHCQKKAEQSIVLGCYIGPQNIYVYDIKDQQLNGVREVTLAHEMLHAAYDRLSSNERDNIDQLLREVTPVIIKQDNSLSERIEIYQKTEPGEMYNELHSIIGTEAKKLPPGLETHYRRYFANRQTVVNLAQSYAKVFDDIKSNQDALVKQLDDLASEINSLSDTYNSDVSRLNQDVQSFNAAASAGNYNSQSEFNNARDDLIRRRDAIESLRSVINQKVDQHDKKRAELEALNIQVDKLNTSLDSTKLPSL